MQARIAGGEIAGAGLDLFDLRTSGGSYGDARADRAAIAFGSYQFEKDTMVGILSVVEKQGRRRSHIEYDHIHVAVIVDVAEGDAAARVHGAIVEADGAGDFVEAAIAFVVIKQERLTILHVSGHGVHVGIDVTAGDEQIEQAGIVKID